MWLKVLPLVVTALGGAAAAILPDLQDIVAQNPSISTLVATLAALLTALAPSPVAKKKPDAAE